MDGQTERYLTIATATLGPGSSLWLEDSEGRQCSRTWTAPNAGGYQTAVASCLGSEPLTARCEGTLLGDIQRHVEKIR